MENKELAKQLSDFTEILENVSDSASETKQVTENFKTEITKEMDEIKLKQENIEAVLMEVKSEEEKKQVSVFDVIMKQVKNPDIPAILGYHNPIERAINCPMTYWDNGKKQYKHSGNGYEVSNEVMMLNDMAVMLGIFGHIASS